MKKRARTHQQTWRNGVWGIANHFGDPWTTEIFESARDAQAYINRQQEKYPNWGLSKHKPVRVSVTVRILKDQSP